MPTFIKPGFWEKAKKGYNQWLNLDDLISQQSVPGPVGPQGPQGSQGIQGPTGLNGAVGPAGLNWQGAWVSGTSYVADDAVGYGGASYFCILATSGTTDPSIDITHWALLASQGAIGPQGAQGPTGPQGAGASQTLQQTVDLGNTITNGSVTSTLSALQFKVADSVKTGITISSGQITSKGDGGIVIVNFPISISGGTKVLTVRDLSGTVLLTRDLGITNTTTSALSLATLNSTYTSYFTGFKVFCPNITGGGLVYSKTGTSTWVSQSITTVV